MFSAPRELLLTPVNSVIKLLLSMARLDHQINEIAEALGSGDCRRLLFLCGVLDTDSSVGRVKEILKSKAQCQEDASLFLRELVWRVGRIDILKKVYQVSGNEVERTVKHRQALPGYRVVMVNISEDLVKHDLEQIKFLLGGILSREKMQNAKSFLDVLIELEKLGSVSPESVGFVEKCLKDIGRLDVAKKVKDYRISVETCEQYSSKQQSHYAARIQQTPQPAARIRAPLSVSREPRNWSVLEDYKFNTNPRGVCVIIDCVGNDGGMLEQTFKALHFNVVLHKWLSANDILSVLRGISGQRENHYSDGFVCCIISRGTTDRLLGIDHKGHGIPMESVRRLFTADSSPMLVGKPKLFFIQRYSVPEFVPWCRTEHRDEDLETDGCSGPAARNYIPSDADVFWSHCWTDERQLEEGQHQSIYLKALTDALHRAQRRKTNVVDVHTEVNGSMFEHNRRNPEAGYHIEIKHTLRKNLYLE